MELLYFFESIRNPVLDFIFALITELGGELVFIIVGMTMFWCVDKKQGYFVLIVGFFGVYINQFLKLIFRIPRPWKIDPEFTIVESAREAATGYSFPSGHTQNAVGCFGAIAACRRERWVRAVCISLCGLIPLSRMYLGVHTPLDVGVSIVVALVLIFVINYFFKRFDATPKLIYTFAAILSVLGVAFMLYCNFWNFPSDIDTENLESAIKNSYSLFGALLGMWAVYIIESRFLKFDTKASPLGQTLKLVIGFPILLLLLEASKPIWNFIVPNAPLARILRYFTTVLFAGAIWPMTFKFFAKVGKKNK